jgi:riboflavin kinase / FMN adenylyltransferase
MRVYYDLAEVGTIKNPVVTMGIFDGVHTGHKAILNRLKKSSKEINGETVIITFCPHPKTVLYPKSKGKNLKMICTKAEKIKLLQEMGIDHLIIISFTKEFASITSRQFIEEILIKKLHVKKVVVGFNHHFGYLKTGNYQILRKMGLENNFEVEEIPAQELENETISSTRVREALFNGDIQRANAYLDHFYYIMGALQNGNPKYSQIGFPMYRIVPEEDDKLIPPPGIYAVSTSFDNDIIHGMLLIERHHTGVKNQTIEIYFFNSEAMNLTGNILSINIHKRVRENPVFNSLEKLKTQLIKDKAKIEELIF